MKKIFLSGPKNKVYIVADKNGYGWNTNGRTALPPIFMTRKEAQNYIKKEKKYYTTPLNIYTWTVV